MQPLLNDLRLGLRILLRNPGSTFAIVALISLGVGTTTVIFSLVEATILRTLPVHNPETLVRMVRRLPKIGTYSEFPFSYYEVLRDHGRTLAAAFRDFKSFFAAVAFVVFTTAAATIVPIARAINADPAVALRYE